MIAPMISPPLRYKIDDWHQLSGVLSNNSRELHISVTDIFDDDNLSGLRIAVNHDKYGTLFAELLNAKGHLINKMKNLANNVFSLTDDNIFNELAKFGFFVEWSKQYEISVDQLEYLRTLYDLRYDKLRLLNVTKTEADGTQTGELYIVVFQANELPKWLDNLYSTTLDEFTQALINGSAMNISAVSHKRNYRWDWLDYVSDIKTVLENA